MKTPQIIIPRYLSIPLHSYIIEQFQSGKYVHEISPSMDGKPIARLTVLSSLYIAHISGEVDISPWIEENVDPKTLYKGVEYLKHTDHPTVKDFHEILGLGEEEYLLCHAYFSTKYRDDFPAIDLL